MSRIITLTLSPAFDLHCACERLCVDHENLATVQSRDAGGKGINISRALTANGIESLAIALLGEDNAPEFERCLRSEGISYKSIPLPGRIRENITLHTANGTETRISFNGFAASDRVLPMLEEMIFEAIGSDPAFYLTLTGRVPDGISMPSLKQFLLRMKERGARIVLDSKSFTTEDVLDVRPWLIKPNEEEIDLYATHPIKSDADAIEAIRALHREGIDNVLLTRGERGALLACAEGVLEADVPRMHVRSTIGAGDSTIAGFLAAHQSGANVRDTLALAVSFGCAACLTEGTKSPMRKDIEQIRGQVSVRP